MDLVIPGKQAIIKGGSAGLGRGIDKLCEPCSCY